MNAAGHFHDPKFCRHCGEIGHDAEHCPLVMDEDEPAIAHFHKLSRQDTGGDVETPIDRFIRQAACGQKETPKQG